MIGRVVLLSLIVFALWAVSLPMFGKRAFQEDLKSDLERMKQVGGRAPI